MGLIRLLARLFVLRIVFKAVRDPDYVANAVEANERATRKSARPRPRRPARDVTRKGRAEVPTTANVAPAMGEERQVPTMKEGGAGPDSPLQLEKSDYKATLKRTLKEIKEDRVTLVAAGMAFYFFLAVFPAFIALIGIYGLFDLETGGLLNSIRETLPAGSGAALTSALERANRPPDDASLVAAIVGIAIALWSASSGMAALQSGMNVAYDVSTERKFVKKRMIGLVLVVATLLLGGVPSPFFTFNGPGILDVVGWVATGVAVVVLFSLFYFLGPNRETPTWKWVSPGGLIGASIWIVVSAAFFLYASQGSYSKTYGPLAGVVVLIFWLYLTSISVLIGGELNAELERQGSKKS